MLFTPGDHVSHAHPPINSTITLLLHYTIATIHPDPTSASRLKKDREGTQCIALYTVRASRSMPQGASAKG